MNDAYILAVHPRDEVVKLPQIEIRVHYFVHYFPDNDGIVHLAMLVHNPLSFLLELLGADFVAADASRIEHAPRGDFTESLSEQL